MQKKDHYKTLELNRDATEDEIKRAYRRLAFRYHPDRNHGNKDDEERFKEIGEAYSVLSDERKRKEYDFLGDIISKTRHYSEDTFESFNFDDIFSKFHSRFNDEPFGDSFCRRGGRGCGRKKAKFFSKIFTKEYSSESPYVVSTYNFPISRSEHVNGTEKEILIKRGYHSQRITVRIPPGLRDGTLLKVSPNEKSDYNQRAEPLYLRIRVVE